MKYLLNIKTGTIHDGSAYCPRINRMAEFNKKWFDKYEDAVNYYSGVYCIIKIPKVADLIP